MRATTVAFALVAVASSVFAHVEIQNPPPFRSKFNKLIDQSTVDFDNNAPLKPNSTEFPCKGFVDDFNSSPAGDSTATWAAGVNQTLTLFGSATHNGGSCQLSLSYDQGKTFRVIKSIEGKCAGGKNGDNTFDFTVPADAKTGKAIFAWTWFNHTGNREMYMNCAAVDITGSGTSTLDDLPEIFTANIGGDCTTTENIDIVFPNAGPDVDVLSNQFLGPPNCGNSDSPPADSPSANSTDPTDPADPADPTPTPTDSADPTDPADSTETAAAAPSNTTGVGPSYLVKTGDTCVDIAAQLGVSVATLLKNNPSINSDCTNLEPDQVVVVRRRSRIMRNLN